MSLTATDHIPDANVEDAFEAGALGYERKKTTTAAESGLGAYHFRGVMEDLRGHVGVGYPEFKPQYTEVGKKLSAGDVGESMWRVKMEESP